jgi:hypothetical protein
MDTDISLSSQRTQLLALAYWTLIDADVGSIPILGGVKTLKLDPE